LGSTDGLSAIGRSLYPLKSKMALRKPALTATSKVRQQTALE
jgi:hypothetical protein